MEESLYERLGSTDGIKRIVDDVMAAHLRNPAILCSLKGEIIRV